MWFLFVQKKGLVVAPIIPPLFVFDSASKFYGLRSKCRVINFLNLTPEKETDRPGPTFNEPPAAIRPSGLWSGFIASDAHNPITCGHLSRGRKTGIARQPVSRPPIGRFCVLRLAPCSQFRGAPALHFSDLLLRFTEVCSTHSRECMLDAIMTTWNS